MFTGLPSQVAEQYGMACLFVPGDEHVTIFAKRPFDRPDFEAAGQSVSLAQAVRSVVGDRPLGIEEGHLGIGVYDALSEAGCAARPSVSILRRWMDHRAGTDLPYFIVAANAVLAGFRRASDYIVRHVQAGVTERDANAIFAAGASEFAKSVGMDGRIGLYFDIIHSGERTLLPAIAGDHPILPAHQTIKFDMGILVGDAFGCVRACSDIARTLSPSRALEQCHDDLRALLVDRLIPQMRPGMSGGDIHALGVRSLRECEAGLRKAGLMREGATMDGYTRDCGHTIHRTTSGSVYFLPGVKETIEPGMLGCVEYVWPIDDKIIAVEDGYYVTDTEVIPFTI
jgi:Xaa-Pro aminopeptidase